MEKEIIDEDFEPAELTKGLLSQAREEFWRGEEGIASALLETAGLDEDDIEEFFFQWMLPGVIEIPVYKKVMFQFKKPVPLEF